MLPKSHEYAILMLAPGYLVVIQGNIGLYDPLVLYVNNDRSHIFFDFMRSVDTHNLGYNLYLE